MFSCSRAAAWTVDESTAALNREHRDPILCEVDFFPQGNYLVKLVSARTSGEYFPVLCSYPFSTFAVPNQRWLPTGVQCAADGTRENQCTLCADCDGKCQRAAVQRAPTSIRLYRYRRLWSRLAQPARLAVVLRVGCQQLPGFTVFKQLPAPRCSSAVYIACFLVPRVCSQQGLCLPCAHHSAQQHRLPLNCSAYP